jgi:hypothetical protein
MTKAALRLEQSRVHTIAKECSDDSGVRRGRGSAWRSTSGSLLYGDLDDNIPRGTMWPGRMGRTSANPVCS